MAGVVGESEEGGEGAVVWCSLPVGEHEFLSKGFRPSRVRNTPLVARAPPPPCRLGRNVEGSQRGELGQVAPVEFFSALQEDGHRGRRRDIVGQRGEDKVKKKLVSGQVPWRVSQRARGGNAIIPADQR